MHSIHTRIAAELSVRETQVEAAIRLLDDGATVPFVARYRKEATGGLDDTQLRTLEKRLAYLRQLEERRAAVLVSIGEQGRLTAELEATIRAAETRTELEDLYLPFRPKRRNRAQIAREAGLDPLAETLLHNPRCDPRATAQAYVCPDRGVADLDAALDGARHILIERFTEDAVFVGRMRERLWEHGRLASRVVAGKEGEGAKFADYFDVSEPCRTIPSHRALAMLRGAEMGLLSLAVEDDEAVAGTQRAAAEFGERAMVAHFGLSDEGHPAAVWLRETVRQAWRARLRPRLEKDVTQRIRESAEEEAINVFRRNLRDLLLAAPAGTRPTIGLDPGLRTGVKVAVVGATGEVLDLATIYPHAPREQWDESIETLCTLAARHATELVAIGNGTASRETDRLVADLIRRHPELNVTKVVVSEAGASVYSASEIAAAELPDLDVSLRGAVSIARRLQDPLAELVKIDPKAIGVGQYQHDVDQRELARALDSVVDDCVNAVGVDVNTASPALLAHVSGLHAGLAANIVAYRAANGVFQSRTGLKKVPRLGEKAFEQAAGFLRIMNGNDPLDRSAVHPEAYPLVKRILTTLRLGIAEVIGKTELLRTLNPAEFTDEQFGEPTVRDVLAELEKPGRDPRPGFATATLKEGVEHIEDLKIGMTLEGTVTNVTNFGAFVDVGVHQDGLVHISKLANRFVTDPHEVVRAGDVVRVQVLAVDLERRRISLSMKLGEDREARSAATDRGGGSKTARGRRQPEPFNPAMASLHPRRR
jgi:protein Tex